MDSNVVRKSRKNTLHKTIRDTTPFFGIYMGIVKDTTDIYKTGRLKVFVPALTKDPDNEESYFDCTWVSPFAGSTDVTKVGTDISKYEHTQKTYGMWMVPPDKENLVLVCFADGNLKHPMVVGCTYSFKYNNMVPGMPSGLSYSDPDLLTPVAEKNRRSENLRHSPEIPRPLHADIAGPIVRQGLINDPIRGAGSSGARRESPSQVFGFLTPGPLDPGSESHRLGGHQFVMDDRIGNRMVRIRTAGGGQLLLDDTTGIIYMINQTGKAWVEMDAFGSIRIFGESDISMRTKGNFNIRADRNVNIEAGQNINLKAVGDTQNGEYVGVPGEPGSGAEPLGVGGTVNVQAARDLKLYAELNGQLTAIGGDVDLNAGGRAAVTAAGQAGIEMLADAGPFKTQSGLETSFLSGSGTRITSGGDSTWNAPRILMNSGGPDATEPEPALAASPLGMSSQQDQGPPPEFDRDAINQGSSGIVNLGRRDPGPVIRTIVPDLVTAEPYAGHAQYDPTQDTPGSIGQSPETATSRAPSISEENQSIYGQVAGSANSLEAAQSRIVSQLENSQQVIQTQLTITPPVRFPTVNGLQQAIVGATKVLSEVESQLRQVAMDIYGNVIDLLSGPADLIRQRAADAFAVLGAGAAFLEIQQALADSGISLDLDGTGQIFTDEFGNTVYDFSNGLGAQGAAMFEQSVVQTAFNDVKDLITVDLSENQTLAIASFAAHIGPDNFARSDVLAALNEGALNSVPRLMSRWNLPADQLGNPPVFDANDRAGEVASTYDTRVEMISARREYEGELFLAFDDQDVGPPEGASPGAYTYRQAAAKLRIDREARIAERLSRGN